jgi:hypothetical protein
MLVSQAYELMWLNLNTKK